MKKLILFSMMCLMALPMWAQATVGDDDYVDLGLPSGTLWKSKNEKGGFKTYDEAVAQFGGNLPTREQWEELKGMCEWSWIGKSYKVTGPSGNSIYLPATGFRECDGDVKLVGSRGFYWSSTPNGSREYSWYLECDLDGYKGTGLIYPCNGLSVRLVQD